MRIRHIRVILLIVICTITLFVNTPQLEFYPNLSEKLPNTIGYLFLISLFVERAIEIFLSAWRSEEAEKKDLSIKQLKKKIEVADGNALKNIDSLFHRLNELEYERIEYSSQSRTYAIWAGIIIGACISMVGVRTLAAVVDTSELDTLHSKIFIFVDMLLTATVLAGGSESINRLMKIYNSFAVSTTNKFK